MGFDTAYEAITEESDSGHRWAFGTGFTDPLAGVDTSVPAGVDGADLAAYCLMLGDDALIMSHRLQQWLTRARRRLRGPGRQAAGIQYLAACAAGPAAGLGRPRASGGRGAGR